LAKDRGAVLAVRAAVRKVVDYREVDVTDGAWWRRYAMLIRELARDTDREVVSTFVAYHQAALAGAASAEGREHHQKALLEVTQEYLGLLAPWNAQSKEERASQQMAEMRAKWAAQYGDPSDPEVQRKIQETVEQMKREAAAAQDTSWQDDDEQMARRMVKHYRRKQGSK